MKVINYKGGSKIKSYLFITDLDDTFLNMKAMVSDEIRERINHMIHEGLQFSFITARDWNSAYKIVKGIEINLPVAVFNGAAVVDFQSHKILEGDYIPIESFWEIVNIANEHQLKVNFNYKNNDLSLIHI